MTSELSLTRRLAKTGLMLIGLWFASTAWRASATVLIFESADGAFGNNLRIPDEYGDRVFEALQDGFRYGTDGGPTPNVQVEYGTGGFPGRALAWSVQFGDLVNVFEIEPEPSDFEMRLVADPGFQVLLHGFDLAGWPHASYTINTVRVSDEADNILFENKDATIWGSADDPMQHTSFDFQNPLLASTIKIYIDSSNLGERSDNIGTDNILFSQQRALSPALQAGDADQDLDFDQFDLLTVQNRGMYRSGQPATWGQGDWNGGPGGQPGRPPVGDGLFDALDLMAALRNGVYRTGSYAAVGKRDREVEFRASVSYDVTTGDISVEVPPETELTAVMLESADGIFTGQPQQAFSGVFDFVTEDTIFKATFGGSFGSLDFQNVARTGLDEEFLLGDLSVVGTLRGGGELGAVSLVYIPEPSALALLAIALVKLGVFRCGRGGVDPPVLFPATMHSMKRIAP